MSAFLAARIAKLAADHESSTPQHHTPRVVTVTQHERTPMPDHVPANMLTPLLAPTSTALRRPSRSRRTTATPQYMAS